MTQEETLQRIIPLVEKIQLRRKHLLDEINDKPQLISYYATRQEETVASTYANLCEFIKKELEGLGIIKKLPLLVVDTIFVKIFVIQDTKRKEPFTPENLLMFVNTLNSFQLTLID